MTWVILIFFSLFHLNFKGFWEMSKSWNSLVAVGLKPGTSRCSDPRFTPTICLFYFPLFVVYSSVTACQITSVWYNWDISFRTLRVRTRWFFFYVPIIPYRSGFAKLSHQRPRASGPVRSSVADMYQDNQARLMPLAVLDAFFFVFDFMSPTDAKPPDALRYGRCPQGVRIALRAPAESTTAGHPLTCRCMPCKMSCIFTAQLAFGLCGLLGFVSRPHQRDYHFVTLGCPLLLLVLRNSTASLGSSAHVRHCVNKYSCMTIKLGACFSAEENSIIILLVWVLPPIYMSFLNALACTGNNTASFFLSLFDLSR